MPSSILTELFQNLDSVRQKAALFSVPPHSYIRWRLDVGVRGPKASGRTNQDSEKFRRKKRSGTAGGAVPGAALSWQNDPRGGRMEGRSCPLLDLPARELSPALVSMGLPRFFFKRTEASPWPMARRPPSFRSPSLLHPLEAGCRSEGGPKRGRPSGRTESRF